MTSGTIAILAVIFVVVAMIAGVIWWATRTDRRRGDELHRRVAAVPPESLDRDDAEWPGPQRGTDVYHGATVADEFTGDYPDASDRQRWTNTGGPADGLPPRVVRDPRRFDAADRPRRPVARTDDGSPRGPYEPLPVTEMTPPTMTPMVTEPVRYADDPPRSYDPAADAHVVDPSTWARPGLQPGEPLTGVSELDRTYGSSVPDPSPPPSAPDPSPPPSYDPPSTYDHGGYSTGGSGGSDYGGSNYGS